MRRFLALPLFLVILGQSSAKAQSTNFVQSNSETPQSPQSSVTVIYTRAQSAGDLNVVIVGWNDSTAQVQSVVDTTGNTYTLAVGPTVQTGYGTQAIYYAKNILAATDGNAVTVTFTSAPVLPDIRIAEYTGVDTVNPLETSAAAQGNSDISDSGAATIGNASDLLVGANLVQGTSLGAGADYTERMTTEDGDILEDQFVIAPGSYHATVVLDQVQPWIMQMVAFRMAPPTNGFVQGSRATPQTPQTSVALPFTGSQSAGNLNVVVVGWNDSTAQVQSVADAVGNSYALAVGPTVQTGYGTQAIYYAKNIAAAAANANTVTVSFTTAAVYPDIRIAEYSGLDTTNPLDASAAAQGNSNISDSAGVTTGNASDLLIGANVVQATTVGPGTGYTQRVITQDGDIFEDRLVSATGSYSASAILGGDQPWIMQMVAFRMAATSGTGAPSITGLSPTSGPTGATVAITGTNFGSTPGNSTVTFNGTAATPTSWSSTQIVVTVPNGASSGAVQVTVSGVGSNTASFIVGTPPSITASVAPPPNAAGWNNTNVTVTFSCTAGSSPVATCPSPQTVTSEGANQSVSGTATGTDGTTATTTVHLNIDKTIPMLAIASPSDASVASSATQPVSGSISDAASGASSVTCNGTFASLSSGNFSCNIPLNVGVNLIVIRATDLAGNVAGSNFHVSLSGTLSAPQSLQITPASANLLVGGTQAFTVVDEVGRPRSDATWTVSDTNIATISTDSSPLLTGIAVGQVTLTATVQGASAQIQVNILGGTSLPLGTIVWSAPTIPGFTSTQIIQAEPVQGGPDLYSVAANLDTKDTVVTALTGQGQQQWSRTFPGKRLSAIADGNGGILLSSYSLSPYDTYIAALFDLDAQTGALLWENDSTGLTGPAVGLAESEAIAPDGTILVQGYTSLALDPKTGTATKLQPANTPQGSLTYRDGGGAVHTVPYFDVPAGASSVAADGTRFQVVSSLDLTFLAVDSDYPTSISRKLYLSRTAPDGSVTFTAFDTETSLVPYSSSFPLYVYDPGCPNCFSGQYPPNTRLPKDVAFRVVPDGQGGAFIPWWKDLGTFPDFEAHLAHVSSSGVTDATLPLAYQNIAYLNSQPCSASYFRPGHFCMTDFQLVLGENGVAFATDLKSVVAFNVASMTPLWTYSSAAGMDLVAATADGGVTINDFQQGLIPLDANGNAGTPSGNSLLTVTPWALGNWIGDPNGTFAEFAGPSTLLADSFWPLPGGNSKGQNSSPDSDFELVWCANNGCSDLPDSNQNVSYFIQADDPPHTTINLTVDQIRMLQLNALNAFKVAFAPYNINVSAGHEGAHTVYIVGTGLSPCGGTMSEKISWSRIFYGPNMQEAQHAVGITTSTPTTDQVNRIVQALGEGIGNNAAHEVGHQLVTKYNRFPGKIVAGMDMHDGSLGTYNGGLCTDPAVFTGFGADGHTPIHWSANADQSLVNIFNRRQ